MSTPFLLDTNAIVIGLLGKEGAKRILEKIGAWSAGPRHLMSVVSHAELLVVAKRKGWGGSKLTALGNAINDLTIVDINHPRVIDAYVQIDLFSRSMPGGARNMGKNDIWIAATAMASGAVLLTSDGDFDHLNPHLLQVERIPARSPGG